MYRGLNEQLEAVQQDILRLQKINSKLEERKKQSEALKDKTAELKKILEKENVDVEKLEERSLSHIFHSILGNLNDRLDKERQEALAARLKYDQAVCDLENANAEIYKLLSERIQYKDSERNYKELCNQKKELLLQANSETAERILQLTQQLGQSQNYRKEIKEAIDVGNIVIDHINIAANCLDSAEGWGTWDLLGGGLISDLMKHSHIDDAKSEVESVQAELSHFRTELADIKISKDIDIQTDGFGKFADFFFDGLIADWCMQSKINESQESVNNTKAQVQKVLNKLKQMEKEQTARAVQLEQEISTLVTQAS
jgi:hypothetical protein